jgi:peptide/nickel transport system permease protein
MATTSPLDSVPAAAQDESAVIPAPTTWQRLRKRWRNLTRTYTFRVVVQGLITIWAVATFTFFLIRLMPGNPVQVRIDQLMQQQSMTYEDAQRLAAGLFNYDPNQPMIEQYLNYFGDLLRGDLGQSIASPGTAVRDQIGRFLPWTLFSIGLALLTSFSLGIVLGAAMAYWRGSIFDNVLTGLASLLAGIPDYVYALLIIVVFGVQLQWFSVGEMRGAYASNLTPGFYPEFFISVIRHALLPVATYVLATVGVWILSMKSSTISTLGEDYITVAKARGLSERRILTAYVGRNAMLPLVSRLAISIGFVVSGSVIVEELFQYPGLGRALFNAVRFRDYTTMQGIFLVTAAAVVVSNILADLLMGWLDPRVQLNDDGGND